MIKAWLRKLGVTRATADSDPDLTGAIWLLESIQVRANIGNNNSRSPTPRASNASHYRQLIRSIQRSQGNDLSQWEEGIIRHRATMKTMAFPSRFEDPDVYSIFSNIATGIDVAIKDLNLKLDKTPIFGTLRTGQINGMAIDFANKKYQIIVMDDGLSGFANMYAKCLLQCLPTETDDGGTKFLLEKDLIIRNLDENPIVAARMFDLVASYVAFGSPYRSQQYFPDRKYISLLVPWLSVMECFALAHEYGHCIAGHLNKGAKRALNIVPSSPPGSGDKVLEEIYPDDWKHEMEADYIGLAIALRVGAAKYGIAPTMSYAAIEAFFRGIETIEAATSILSTGTIEKRISATHPPGPIRRQALRLGLQNLIEEKDADQAMHTADLFGAAIEHINSQLTPLLTQMHADGTRPDAKWL